MFFFDRKRPEQNARFKGRQMRQETKNRISEAWAVARKTQHGKSMAGDHNPFMGKKKHSKFTKTPISKAISRRKLSEIAKRKISDRMTGVNYLNWNKPLSEVTKEKLVTLWTTECKANSSGECHLKIKPIRALAAKMYKQCAHRATCAYFFDRSGLYISTIWQTVIKAVWSEK